MNLFTRWRRAEIVARCEDGTVVLDGLLLWPCQHIEPVEWPPNLMTTCLRCMIWSWPIQPRDKVTHADLSFTRESAWEGFQYPFLFFEGADVGIVLAPVDTDIDTLTFGILSCFTVSGLAVHATIDDTGGSAGGATIVPAGCALPREAGGTRYRCVLDLCRIKVV